jgi:hypothetical protein
MREMEARERGWVIEASFRGGRYVVTFSFRHRRSVSVRTTERQHDTSCDVRGSRLCDCCSEARPSTDARVLTLPALNIG